MRHNQCGQYVFVWKTDRSLVGSCKQLLLDSTTVLSKRPRLYSHADLETGRVGESPERGAPAALTERIAATTHAIAIGKLIEALDLRLDWANRTLSSWKVSTLAADDVRRWTEVGPQWSELCSRFLEANHKFRAASAAAKAGVPGAHEAANRWAVRVREAEADCVHFMKRRA